LRSPVDPESIIPVVVWLNPVSAAWPPAAMMDNRRWGRGRCA